MPRRVWAALRGAVAVPETVVGLADIPTGGAVGQFLENKDGMVGFRPKQAKEAIARASRTTGGRGSNPSTIQSKEDSKHGKS